LAKTEASPALGMAEGLKAPEPVEGPAEWGDGGPLKKTCSFFLSETVAEEREFHPVISAGVSRYCATGTRAKGFLLKKCW
jgi:hypothetical protein